MIQPLNLVITSLKKFRGQRSTKKSQSWFSFPADELKQKESTDRKLDAKSHNTTQMNTLAMVLRFYTPSDIIFNDDMLHEFITYIMGLNSPLTPGKSL